MPRDPISLTLTALGTALGVEVRPFPTAPEPVRNAALHAIEEQADGVQSFTVDGDRFLICGPPTHHDTLVILGPYRRPHDCPGAAPILTADDEARAHAVLHQAAESVGQIVALEHERQHFTDLFELINSAAIAITGELELDVVLRRIVDLAREIVGAKYAALGMANAAGEIEHFIPSGVSEDEQRRIGHPPLGRGILGLLISERSTIRLADLRSHPASVGFPPWHPPMRTFLGVPITSRGRVLGNLYLTEKQGGTEFTEEDVQLVELLARYAGVAIENAGLYRDMELQQTRLQTIIERLPEAVLVLEPHPERVTFANSQASRLLGWSVTPPVPLETFLDVNMRIDAEGNPLTPEQIPVVRALRFGETSRQEILMRRPDGSVLTVLVNAAPIHNDAGSITAAIAVFQDITQIRDAEQLKDDFLSLVSHELRTPMTTIQGGALVLLQDSERLDEETQRQILTDIAGESRRLAGLVENMVQLANIRAGRFGMEVEPIHVATLLHRAVAAINDAAPEHTFDVQIERNLLALGDEGRIDQVVRNLLHNAVKYAPAGPPIEVRATRDQDMVVVSVRDHGPGIDEEDLPFVFERFRRGKQATLRNTAGMGLGLFLSKHLVEAHGGQIWIERPADGGTTILFSMPRIGDEE